MEDKPFMVFKKWNQHKVGLMKFVWGWILMMNTLTHLLGIQAEGKPDLLSDRGRVAVYYSDLFLSHDTGEGHPERPDRLRSIVAEIHRTPALREITWPTWSAATEEELESVHDRRYIESVREDVESGRRQLRTGDTMISRETWKVALLAAGSGIAACDAVISGSISSAFCLVRPPGHHATKDRGMGFCVFNNVAIAARSLQKRDRIKRVLIIDFDVHHGNGTQDIFYHDGSVFYFSVHQKGIYPGSGRSTEIGEGKGKGATLNVELDEGSGDAAGLAAFRERLRPAMAEFKPEFILVSAGFDAHQDDPLGGLAYTESGYASFAREILALAKLHAGGRMVWMLEGGYGLKGLAGSVVEILKVLHEVPTKKE
jgi:acetoin utilization deacetylase AcuC-like enzyme